MIWPYHTMPKGQQKGSVKWEWSLTTPANTLHSGESGVSPKPTATKLALPLATPYDTRLPTWHSRTLRKRVNTSDRSKAVSGSGELMSSAHNNPNRLCNTHSRDPFTSRGEVPFAFWECGGLQYIEGNDVQFHNSTPYATYMYSNLPAQPINHLLGSILLIDTALTHCFLFHGFSFIPFKSPSLSLCLSLSLLLS